MFDDVVRGNITYILSHFNSIQELSCLSVVSKLFHNAIMDARSSWLRIAVERTGYCVTNTPSSVCALFDANSALTLVYDPTTGASVSFDLSNIEDFWYRLRLLLCPWMSMPRELISTFPRGDGQLCEAVEISVVGDKLIAKLILNDDGFSEYYACNARRARDNAWIPCEVSSNSTAEGNNVDGVIENAGTFDGSAGDEDASSGIRGDELRITKYHNKCFRIHKTAVAVVDVFFDDSLDADGTRSGIFFVSYDGKRVFRHMVLNPIKFRCEVAVCASVCEAWFMANDVVHYFGPSRNGLMITDPRTLMGHAIYMIAKNNAPEAVAYVERMGLDINQPSDMYDQTLLHFAAEYDDPKAVMEILKAKADPNALDCSGISSLGIAACFCSQNAINALKGKVDPNMRNESGNTPLHVVGIFNYGDEEGTMRLLLECGCDPTIVNAQGESGLDELARHGIVA